MVPEKSTDKMSKQKVIICKKSYSSYRNGCRCADCKAIGSIHNRKRNRKRAARVPVEPLVEKLPQDFRNRYKTSIVGWEKNGITVFVADKICCEYGVHPWVVYGDSWYWNINEGNLEVAI